MPVDWVCNSQTSQQFNYQWSMHHVSTESLVLRKRQHAVIHSLCFPENNRISAEPVRKSKVSRNKEIKSVSIRRWTLETGHLLGAPFLFSIYPLHNTPAAEAEGPLIAFKLCMLDKSWLRAVCSSLNSRSSNAIAPRNILVRGMNAHTECARPPLRSFNLLLSLHCNDFHDVHYTYHECNDFHDVHYPHNE